MVPSRVLHVVGGRGLSRVVSFARCFPCQDVDECTETFMHGTDAPKVASADHTSDDSSSFDLLSSEFGNVQAESKTHVADPSPGLGVTGDVVLVGAVGHDLEGNDKARKGGRGQRPRPSQ